MAARSPRTRLVVLFGGRSAEHDVSRVTARHVLAATNPEHYDIVPIAIDRRGRWLDAVAARQALTAGPSALPDALEVDGPAVDPLPALEGAVDAQVVVLPLLHGPYGEDGTVQGLLELADVPYVGAGVLGSALAMDKAKAKEICAANGIPQPEYLAYRADRLPDDIGTIVADRLAFPAFVKPSNLGSSIGVSKVRDPGELDKALDLALSYDEWVVIEEAIAGREIELAVLGNTEPKVSVPGEIEPGADFYDYEDKYLDGAEVTIPADLDPRVTAELQELAIHCFEVLRAEGMARVDFFYEDGGRGALLNEINTIPGFTPISMYPKLWEASGLAYPDLIDELVQLAIERHQRRSARTRVTR